MLIKEILVAFLMDFKGSSNRSVWISKTANLGGEAIFSLSRQEVLLSDWKAIIVFYLMGAFGWQVLL